MFLPKHKETQQEVCHFLHGGQYNLQQLIYHYGENILTVLRLLDPLNMVCF